MSEPCDLTLCEASAAMDAGALSPVELVRSTLGRIDALEPTIRSYITIQADAALDAARSAEREIALGHRRGPLHGIPYSLKDNYLTAGVRTTSGSAIYADHIPTVSATAHERLQRAGAILIGKNSTYEFGTGDGSDSLSLPFPPARNPWNPMHFTGGSSTGSGAGVAAGTAIFALGFDSNGSIRLPAAGCGLFGLKPSYGLVSKAGILPNAWSLDHAGPLTRCAADAALVLASIAGFDPSDPSSATCSLPNLNGPQEEEEDLRGVRLGILRDLRHPPISQEISAAFEAAIELFRCAGAEIVELQLARPLSDYVGCSRIINMTECFAAHEETYRSSGHRMSPALRDKLLAGSMIRAADYLRAQRWRNELVREVEQALVGCDAAISPAAMDVAPRLDRPDDIADFTTRAAMAPFSLAGIPAASLCSGFSADGLPLSLQIAAPRFDEATLLRIARIYETATGHWRRRPDVRKLALFRDPLHDSHRPQPPAIDAAAQGRRVEKLVSRLPAVLGPGVEPYKNPTTSQVQLSAACATENGRP